MNVSTLVRTMTAKRDALKSQLDKLDAAIRALSTYTRVIQPKEKRVRHVRYKVTCKRCGKVFKAKRTPNGKNPNRNPKFCNQPCNSAMYLRDQRKKKAQYNPKISGTPGGVTILKGDTLTAGH
jgi:arginyl-tRNA--protein-N-Asp/Glu arginylyltransferase